MHSVCPPCFRSTGLIVLFISNAIINSMYLSADIVPLDLSFFVVARRYAHRLQLSEYESTPQIVCVFVVCSMPCRSILAQTAAFIVHSILYLQIWRERKNESGKCSREMAALHKLFVCILQNLSLISIGSGFGSPPNKANGPVQFSMLNRHNFCV